MSMSLEEIEALELPIRERASLAHRLLEGLAQTEPTKGGSRRSKANTSPSSTITRRSTDSLRRKLTCSTTSRYLRRRCIR
jgi:hypothetical protein